MAEEQQLQHFAQWARARDDVRAVILTSTRARPDAALDPFSDYDVILAVTDVMPYFNSRDWLYDFGAVLALYRDPLRGEEGQQRFAYITQYEANFLKIDFTVMNVALLQQIVAAPQLPDDLDVGYHVLLDKDDLTANLAPPTYQAFKPQPPTREQYHECIELVFHEATYVAKNIWRDELLPAKYSLHIMMQGELRPMLEWYLTIQHDGQLKMGSLGKGLKRYLPADWWSQLGATFVGGDSEANWNALFGMIALFREVAESVGAALGYEYPDDLHQRGIAYLQSVRDLPRP